MGKISDVIGLGCPTPLAEYLVSGSIGATISSAGSSITDATALTKLVNNVSTVATGQGVKLPDEDIGVPVVVRSAGNAQLNVYPPTSSGTINNLSAGVPLPLPSQTIATFTRISSTAWMVEIGATQGVENGITASGTIITDAYDLSRNVNGITTAAASTGVQLFAATIGIPVYVGNGGGNTVNVWPPDASSTINNAAAGAAKTIAAGNGATFVRMTSTAWIMSQ